MRNLTIFINSMRDMAMVLFLCAIASASLGQIAVTPAGLETCAIISVITGLFGFIFGGGLIFATVLKLNRS